MGNPARRSRRNIGLVAIVVVIAVGAVLRLSDEGRPDPRAQRADPLSGNPGTAPQASPTALPWSESALAVAVQGTDGAAIHLVPLSGAGPRVLADDFDAVGAPAWSPDGRTLAFAARREANWDLFAVAAKGGAPVRLTDHPDYDGAPAWSADGRQLAFVSSRDGGPAVYRLSVATLSTRPSLPPGEPAVSESAPPQEVGAASLVAAGDGPLTDPAWSPGGEIVFAAWHEGGYQLEVAAADGSGRRTLVEGEPGVDLRAPSFRADNRSAPGDADIALAYLRVRNGEGRLETRAVLPNGAAAPLPELIAVQIDRYAWLPSGALLVGSASRGRFEFSVRDGEGRLHSVAPAVDVLAGLPAPAIAWTLAPPDPTLPAVRRAVRRDPTTEKTGLLSLSDVDVSGPRIHQGLAADFEALRREVAGAVGRDFLGTLSDMWRPLGYDSDRSAFFSWHKTGRAFDSQMELRGPGGRRDMVLVREDDGGRTVWRMFLRAEAQDGTVGRPLDEPGWSFAAGSGDRALTAQGGRRGDRVPEGYWIDFTALAAELGWQRIPSLTSRSLNWHRDWVALEYWHYERRDGLRWFEAAAQAYTEDELAGALSRDRLKELGISLSRLARLGFPPGWFSPG